MLTDEELDCDDENVVDTEANGEVESEDTLVDNNVLDETDNDVIDLLSGVE